MPSGRCGHTMTKISDNCFVLIGGIKFRNRLSDQSLSLFKQFPSDMTFVFVLDIQAFTWKKITVDGNITQLAYCTSCFFPHTNKIILTGGIKFEDSKASEYLGFSELIVYDLNSLNDKNKVISETVLLNVDPQISLFMSGHCCSVSEENIFLFGGHQTLTSKIDEREKPRAGSKELIINLKTLSCSVLESATTNTTSGATCFWSDKNLICVMDGENIFAHWKINVKLETHLKSIQLDGPHGMFVD